jgi:hypothetical protein
MIVGWKKFWCVQGLLVRSGAFGAFKDFWCVQGLLVRSRVFGAFKGL